MIERFVNPSIKYTTNTLGSLPGAKLYFYTEGTSTPKTVYQDDQMVTAHAHPVEADMYGLFAPIFLNGTYRVELKDAGGTTQTGWPIDNVGGYPNLIDNDLIFVGTGLKIKGDFSNTTASLRPTVQTNISNSITLLDVAPSGTFNTSGFVAFSSSDKNNASTASITISNSEMSVSSYKNGTGGVVPMRFYTNFIKGLDFDATTGVPTVSAGLKFPNSAISDATINDYYLESILAPAVVGTSSAGTATYSVQSGSSTRGGNRVNGEISLTWTGHTGTGNMRISGLPFTVGRTTPVSVFYSDLVVGAGKQLCSLVVVGQTYVNLYACDPSGGAYTPVTMAAAGSIQIQFSHEV